MGSHLDSFNRVIGEAKAIDKITDLERGQILNYLKESSLNVGVILNFKHARVKWERVVLWYSCSLVFIRG